MRIDAYARVSSTHVLRGRPIEEVAHPGPQTPTPAPIIRTSTRDTPMLNLDPHGLAAVALFLGVTVLITYLTRDNAEAKAIIDELADL